MYNVNLSNIFGYTGAGFLLIRFIPLLYEQFRISRIMNLGFLFIELLACVCCGISAFLLKAYPLVAANAASFICIIIIICIQVKLRYKQRILIHTESS